MKLNIVGGAYSSSAPLSVQECVNLYPELAEGGGRNDRSLIPTPGCAEYRVFEDGPVRGAHVMDGTLYAVSGDALYAGATFIGKISGSGRVSMQHNAANQLIVANGSEAWTYDGTFALNADFPGGHVFAYLDGYVLTNEPGTRRFWASGLDNYVWNGLDFASKEGDQYPLVTGIENNEDVILFGQKTIEFWRDTGNADFQFEKQTGVSQERGCGAEHSLAQLDNTVYFLGDDKIVYKLEGYRPVRISDHAIEKFLEGKDVSQATAFTYTANGHYFYVLNVQGKTWVYDATYSGQTQKATWHERRSDTRWRAENYVYFDNKHLVGDFALGTLWELTGHTDAGVPVARFRTCAPVFAETRLLDIVRLELKFRASGTVFVQISKDGGRTWSERLLHSVTTGDYEQLVVWRSLGNARDWVFRFGGWGDVSLIDAYATVNVADD